MESSAIYQIEEWKWIHLQKNFDLIGRKSQKVEDLKSLK